MTNRNRASERQRCLLEVERWQAIGTDMHGLARGGVPAFLVPGDAEPSGHPPEHHVDRLRAALREVSALAYSFAGHYRRIADEQLDEDG